MSALRYPWKKLSSLKHQLLYRKCSLPKLKEETLLSIQMPWASFVGFGELGDLQHYTTDEA